MPKGPQGQSRPADAIARAIMVAQIATGERMEAALPSAKKMTAVKLGGERRSETLSAEQRSEISRKAAKKRWSDD